MIEKIFIIVFLVWFISCTMWEGMILDKIPSYVSRIPKIPLWLVKVLFECIICGTMWYGTAIYWIVWGNNWHEYLICTAAATGVNALIVTVAKL